MTQLDLPQISLSRYLDLLKRRKWRVVPASLAGLVIGGLVAFFVPRYYVADMKLDHSVSEAYSHGKVYTTGGGGIYTGWYLEGEFWGIRRVQNPRHSPTA